VAAVQEFGWTFGRKPPEWDDKAMAKCAYCGSTIVMGGLTQGAERFCNANCRNNAFILNLSQSVPPDLLQQKLEEVWRGKCPKCGGYGPVDVHKAHQVWSLLVLTQWKSRQFICCRSCGTKQQILGLLFSGVAGWWGFPWGLILTPVQITRNIIGMCGGPDRSSPSANLRKAVQVQIGSQIYAASRQKTPPPVPSP
jgi:hypothetical protein